MTRMTDRATHTRLVRRASGIGNISPRATRRALIETNETKDARQPTCGRETKRNTETNKQTTNQRGSVVP